MGTYQQSKTIVTMRRVRLVTTASGMGFGVAVIGSIAMLGYTINQSALYTWLNGAPMALPTALALTLAGIAIVILAEYVRRHE